MATYAGFHAAGLIGGIVATFSLVLPSLIVIVIIAKILDKFNENPYVKSSFAMIRPVVTGLIATAVYGIFQTALFTAKDGSRINRSYMFSEYEEYCKENDRQSHGKSVFLRMMKDKGYRIKRTQDGYFFMDVAFRDPGFGEVEPEEKVPFEQMKLDLRYKEGG